VVWTYLRYGVLNPSNAGRGKGDPAAVEDSIPEREREMIPPLSN